MNIYRVVGKIKKKTKTDAVIGDDVGMFALVVFKLKSL